VRVPVFLAALLLARGLPALLYARVIGRSHAVTAGLLQATSLPFIVTAAQIGVAVDAVSPVSAVPFPTIAAARLGTAAAHTPASADV